MALWPPERNFRTQVPFSTFAWKCLLVSLVPCLALVPIYIATSPTAFWETLVSMPAARARLIRQLLTNGLPVIFAVNYVGFFLFATFSERRSLGIRYIALDALLRPILFVVLHVVIYALSADFYGSFGGDRAQGMRVVFPTLERSAFLENLSGVYLYSVLLPAIPLYVRALQVRSTSAAPAKTTKVAAHEPWIWPIVAAFSATFVALVAMTLALGTVARLVQ